MYLWIMVYEEHFQQAKAGLQSIEVIIYEQIGLECIHKLLHHDVRLFQVDDDRLRILVVEAGIATVVLRIDIAAVLLLL